MFVPVDFKIILDIKKAPTLVSAKERIYLSIEVIFSNSSSKYFATTLDKHVITCCNYDIERCKILKSKGKKVANIK